MSPASPAVQELDLSSPLAFLVVAGLALVDGVVPLVPAYTAVIGLGVLAAEGDLRAYPLLALASVAAFLSDNLSYWLGARLWPRFGPTLLRGARSRQFWTWLEHQLRTHGMLLVTLARVVPGGPTPITLTAGSVRLSARKFRIAAATGALLWSAYAFGVGIIGSAIVGDHPLLAVVAGLALAVALNACLRVGFRRGCRGDSG
jgi:membrane-associated protein